jgi:hypothetical protein
MSQLLWGIDWRRHFPIAASQDGVVIEVGDADSAESFARDNFESIFGPTLARERQVNQFSGGAARHTFVAHACDVFVFRDGEDVVGLFVGNPIDWSTYYIRSTSFVAAYQGLGLHKRLLAALFQELAAAGVERVEAETAVSNLHCISALTRSGFVASGTVLSERWGALARFTRHLHEPSECEYLNRFSHSPNAHRRHTSRNTRDS